MGNPQKRKGSDFERQAVELLNSLVNDSEWKKIPGSGALGTTLDEPSLTADISGNVSSIPKKFKVECKVGYGGATQLSLKKEWLDKVKKEADATYSIPVLLGKFSGSRDGVKVFAVMDIEVFAGMLNYITDLKEKLQVCDAVERK